MTKRLPRVISAVVVGLLVLSVAALGGWAAAQVFGVEQQVEQSQGEFATAVVQSGQISSTMNLNSTVSWPVTSTVSNQAVGTVTSVDVLPGEEVDTNSVLYKVNLRPVVVATGDVPAFRAIGDGDRGDDVSQLQHLLRTAGYYRGNVDGTAGSLTVSAIERWQKALGLEQTGTVGLGDVVFVPELPARIILDSEAIKVGASVTGGERALTVLSKAPTFAIAATIQQAGMIPDGAVVSVASPDGTSTWTGAIGQRNPDEAGESVSLSVVGAEEASLCRDECGTVPVSGEVLLAAEIELVPPQEGLTVPVAAIRTTPSGQTVVIESGSGQATEVRVVASAQGIALIEGAPRGLRVRIPAEG